MAAPPTSDIVVPLHRRQTEMTSKRIEERRSETRYSPGIAGSLIPALIGQAASSVVVRNISLGGIGLVVDQDDIPQGDRVIIQLYNSARSCWHLKLARVVYALPGNDESWTVGCSFVEPLDQEDYQGLIAGGGA
jgi:hypothetical protein